MLSLSQSGVIAAYVLMIVMNALSTATTVFNNTDNGKISRENPTYLSPDGATFSIWGFIYLFETCFVIYQALPKYANAQGLGGETRMWLIAAFLVNSMWLPVFAYHLWWLSLVVILCYLGALAKTYESLGVEYGGKATAATKIFAFTGISLNFGWVVVASLLNFTIVSRNSGIIVTRIVQGNITKDTAGSVAPLFNQAIIGGNVDWAIAAGVCAAGIACYRAIRYSDIPYCFVTAWALGGIYRMQTYAGDRFFPEEGKSHDLATWALTLSLIVGVFGLFALAQAIFKSLNAQQMGDRNDDQEVEAGNSLTRSLSSSATRV